MRVPADEDCTVVALRDANGNLEPLETIATDNGGPFRSFGFEAFIATYPSCVTSAPGFGRQGA